MTCRGPSTTKIDKQTYQHGVHGRELGLIQVRERRHVSVVGGGIEHAHLLGPLQVVSEDLIALQLLGVRLVLLVEPGF